jgi:hypothetical protein
MLLASNYSERQDHGIKSPIENIHIKVILPHMYYLYPEQDICTSKGKESMTTHPWSHYFDYYFARTHQNPLGSIKDLSIHRDRQREATLFYIKLVLTMIIVLYCTQRNHYAKQNKRKI